MKEMMKRKEAGGEEAGTSSNLTAEAMKRKMKADVARCNSVGENGAGIGGDIQTEAFHVVREDGKEVHFYPWGVVLLRGFVSEDEVQTIYEECRLGRGGAYEHDQILENEEGHPDQIYNDFVGHANMFLHWNYYNGPVDHQQPPLTCLGAGDRAFREFRTTYYDEAKWKQAMGVTPEKPGLSARLYAVHHRHLMCPEITNSRTAVEEMKSKSQAATFAVGSILGITYGPEDTFYWHTDESGDAGEHAGWLMSISMGAPATFEYKTPTVSSIPATVYSVEVRHGDCLFSNGGVLEHRVAAVHSDRVPPEFAAIAGPSISRLNLQIRKYGVDDDYTYNAIVRPDGIDHEEQ